MRVKKSTGSEGEADGKKEGQLAQAWRAGLSRGRVTSRGSKGYTTGTDQ